MSGAQASSILLLQNVLLLLPGLPHDLFQLQPSCLLQQQEKPALFKDMPGNCIQSHRLELSDMTPKCKEDSVKCTLYSGPPCAHLNFRGSITEVKEEKGYQDKATVSATEAIRRIVAGARHDLIFSFEKNHFVHYRGNGYRWVRLELGQLGSKFSSLGGR